MESHRFVIERSDMELLERFEAADFEPGEFGHTQHLRVAWTLLAQVPVVEALQRIERGIRALARAQNAPNLFHATVTWAYVFLVHERMLISNGGSGWIEFLESNPDLGRHADGALRARYDAATLDSDEARRSFVLPRPRSRSET